MKYYKVTTKQWHAFGQVNAFDGWEPILFKDGNWGISVDFVNDHLYPKYVTNFARSGATPFVRDTVIALKNWLETCEVVDYEPQDLHPVQKCRRREGVLEEKTRVELFVKETIGDDYDENDTIAQLYSKIERKPGQVKPMPTEEMIEQEMKAIFGKDYDETKRVSELKAELKTRDLEKGTIKRP